MDTPTGYRRIETSLRGLARGARRVGDADPRETFSVSIRVRRQSGAPPLPGQDHWAVTPIGKRRFLSRQQFAAQYGAAQEDLDRVANFARSQGLTVLESSIARRTVVVSGTAEQMSRTFAVELGHYESPEGSYRGREGYIHLPNDVADLITGVFGLDNRRVVWPSGKSAPKGARPLTPPQVASLYNFPTWKASGQTIGIFEFALGADDFFGCGYSASDIAVFMTSPAIHAAVPKITAVSVGGTTNAPAGSITNVFPGDNDVEAALDLEVSGSVAQGADLVVYFAIWDNTADNYFSGSGSDASSSPYNSINGGDGDGPDIYGDVTLVNTAVGYNATLASDNIFTGAGSIGLFGRSRGHEFSMGVLGQSSKGCAIYGLATDENPATTDPSHGIGVVGRSMGGVSPEEISVESIMVEPIGVLGNAMQGPGVRGHSGPLLTLTKESPGPLPITAAPGGVFSSGQLQDSIVFGSTAAQEVSLDSSPQLRLTPSTGPILPKIGQI